MSEYLQHHGIKGQKWGVRRFQNEDGSLTAEGQERYGKSKDYGGTESGIRRMLAGRTHTTGSKINILTGGDTRKRKENRLQKKIDKYTVKRDEARADKEYEWAGSQAYADKMQRKIDKTQRKLDAQKLSNANTDAYNRHASTGKLVAQNVLTGFGLTPVGRALGNEYRHYRAAGEGRVKSMMAASNPLYGMYLDKKNYGYAFVAHSDAD